MVTDRSVHVGVCRFLVHRLVGVMVLLLFSFGAVGQETVELLDVQDPAREWTFFNGAEFPGAKGGIAALRGAGPAGATVARLVADLTGGGMYVSIERACPPMDIHRLNLELKYPGAEKLTFRLIDSAGTCHQLAIHIDASDDWQTISLPLKDIFKHMGTSKSPACLAKYESWGKASKAGWQPPLARLVLLAGNASRRERPDVLLLNRISAEIRETVTTSRDVRLDAIFRAGQLDWTFHDGREFPGAKGNLSLVDAPGVTGGRAMQLRGDFTGGGAYVSAGKTFDTIEADAFERLTFHLKSSKIKAFTLRLVDGSGQCFQRRMPFTPGDEWTPVVVHPRDSVGAEHWGGAKDGKWHAPLTHMAILLGGYSCTDKKPEVLIADLSARILVETESRTVYTEPFASKTLPAGWETRGNVSLSGAGGRPADYQLRLARTEDQSTSPVWALSPVIAVVAGTIECSGAMSSDVRSPDNSYRAAVSAQFLDANGRVIGRPVEVGAQTGKNARQPFKTRLQAPSGSVAVRLKAELQKTWGHLLVDALSVVRLASTAQPPLIDRVVTKPKALGALYDPGSRVEADILVAAREPLVGEALRFDWCVTDFWGMPQGPAGSGRVDQVSFKAGRFDYSGSVGIEPADLEVGKYYELVVCLPGPAGTEASGNTIGFALLPEAPANAFPPEDIPFHIRNWDNRIPAYFRLANRLGIRYAGVWGRWRSKAPYQPEFSGATLCKTLGMGWVVGTMAGAVEQGKYEYTDTVLRGGMRALLEASRDNPPAMVTLGNEPHGGLEKKKRNVAAYQAVYEAVKAHDPNLFVVGTSVPADREYFELGYQNYLDAYDFHTYETYRELGRRMRAYFTLMKEFSAEKPLFCTEFGLNSQGLSRLMVASELYKKYAVFFAEGGANASWFTIMYPDPDGDKAKDFGQAHNVFDCRYNQYNPKLDAVAYYHTVNGILNRRFRERKTYADGSMLVRFADDAGENLVIGWNEAGRRAVALAFPGVEQVVVRRVDGTARTLVPGRNGAVTVDFSPEPVLLSYRAVRGALPSAPGVPALSVPTLPSPATKGQTLTFAVTGAGLTAERLHIGCPAPLTVRTAQSGADTVTCCLAIPRETTAREIRLMLQRGPSPGHAHSAVWFPIPVRADD